MILEISELFLQDRNEIKRKSKKFVVNLLQYLQFTPYLKRMYFYIYYK